MLSFTFHLCARPSWPHMIIYNQVPARVLTRCDSGRFGAAPVQHRISTVGNRPGRLTIPAFVLRRSVLRRAADLPGIPASSPIMDGVSGICRACFSLFIKYRSGSASFCPTAGIFQCPANSEFWGAAPRCCPSAAKTPQNGETWPIATTPRNAPLTGGKIQGFLQYHRLLACAMV